MKINNLLNKWFWFKKINYSTISIIINYELNGSFEISSERDEISLPFINKIEVRNPFLDNKSESEEVSQDNKEGQSRFFFQDKKEENKSITKNTCSSQRTNTKPKTEPLITKKTKFF